RLRPNLSVALGLRYEWQNYGAGSGNFAPRLSFAYALDKAAKTIVRGGAGLFYDVFPASDIRDTLLLNGTRLQQFRALNADYPSPAAGAAAALPPDVAQFSPTLRSPYLLQYSLAVERQVRKSLTWSTTITNLRGIDLYRSRDANAPPPPLYAARPVSSIGALHLYESSGGLKSYGLQTALRGDLTRYFKGMVMYELARASNDTDGIGAFPANNWNLNGEWARASFDVRHYIYLYGTVNAGKWLKFGVVF